MTLFIALLRGHISVCHKLSGRGPTHNCWPPIGWYEWASTHTLWWRLAAVLLCGKIAGCMLYERACEQTLMSKATSGIPEDFWVCTNLANLRELRYAVSTWLFVYLVTDCCHINFAQTSCFEFKKPWSKINSTVLFCFGAFMEKYLNFRYMIVDLQITCFGGWIDHSFRCLCLISCWLPCNWKRVLNQCKCHWKQIRHGVQINIGRYWVSWSMFTVILQVQILSLRLTSCITT